MRDDLCAEAREAAGREGLSEDEPRHLSLLLRDAPDELVQRRQKRHPALDVELGRDPTVDPVEQPPELFAFERAELFLLRVPPDDLGEVRVGTELAHPVQNVVDGRLLARDDPVGQGLRRGDESGEDARAGLAHGAFPGLGRVAGICQGGLAPRLWRVADPRRRGAEPGRGFIVEPLAEGAAEERREAVQSIPIVRAVGGEEAVDLAGESVRKGVEHERRRGRR